MRFAAGVLEELARSPVHNVRELQGALNRLMAHQALLDAPLGLTEVWHVLGSARSAETAPPDEFVTACARLGQPQRVMRGGERISIAH